MNEIQLFMSGNGYQGGAMEIRACGIDLGTTNSSVAEAIWVAWRNRSA